LQWFGDDTQTPTVVGLDQPLAGWRRPYHNDLAALGGFLARFAYVFTSGQGALFVPCMAAAFPPVRQVPIGQRIGRRFVQRLLGLPHFAP
jgi:hypothetical protein